MANDLLDDFTDLSGWSTVSSGDAILELSSVRASIGNGLRLSFDFKGGGGFVVARKSFHLELPETYAFEFLVRGAGPSNILEFKLVDSTGFNVWRYRDEAFPVPADWKPVRIRSSQIDFAWGPAGGGPARDASAIEIVIAAGPGGDGFLEIAGLQFRDESYRATPSARASSALSGFPPGNVLRSDGSSWRSENSGPQWLEIDFQRTREFGGLVIDWDGDLAAREFDISLSADGVQWHTAYATSQGGGSRSYLYLPDADARYLKIALRQSMGESGFGIRCVEVKPSEFSKSLNGFFESIARDHPVGSHPKYLLRKQSYWTPIGTGFGTTQGLINEEGLVEIDKGAFSVEPFLHVNGTFLSWADVNLTQGLEQGYLPIPWVRWRWGNLSLTILAFAAETSGEPALYIRYRLAHAGAEPAAIRLFAAIRPFQATPAWQHWRQFGGVSEIRSLDYRDGMVLINGNKRLLPLDMPDQFGAAAFAEGPVTDFLVNGQCPPHAQVRDEFGYASGALGFEFSIAPGEEKDIFLAAPFGYSDAWESRASYGALQGIHCFEQAISKWEALLNTFEIRLPPTAQEYAATMKTAAAHILINRNGPALHPGPRRYDRAWIRDGVLMGVALMQVGHTEPLKEFLRWYARFQAESGALPDCADQDGTEWLPEYDAYGQFLHGVVEAWRYGNDTDFLIEMQPAARKALRYMEELRSRRLTEDYRSPAKRACYGLLPESMSHEGYMAHPVHAYWDDFWALRGIKDAALMHAILGDNSEAMRLLDLEEAFSADLYASLQLAMDRHHIDFVPGSVELGDFDPAATAIALGPIDETHRLPNPAIGRTFDRFLDGLRERIGKGLWNNYSAYEIRIAGALVRLGRRDDARELADFLLKDRRIPSWNQWPEISWRDARGPSFVGDLPHSWISAEYIMAVRTMFLYEREADQSIVIAAGVTLDWLADRFELTVENLPSCYGTLSYRLCLEDAHTLRVILSGDLRMPLGGIVVLPPLPSPIVAIETDTKPIVEFSHDSVTCRLLPAKFQIKLDGS